MTAMTASGVHERVGAGWGARDSRPAASTAACHDPKWRLSTGGAIDSVLDTKLRTRRLADLFDPVFAQYQTRALCRLCGHELHIDSLRISQSQVLHGSLMSPTWQQAVHRIHKSPQQREPSP